MVAPLLNAALSLRRGAGPRVGAERIALLEALDELGSIRAAAARVGLSYKAAWDAVRRLPEVRSLGLALPRILLRLPHGKDTTPVDSFDFEEVPDGSAHETRPASCAAASSSAASRALRSCTSRTR